MSCVSWPVSIGTGAVLLKAVLCSYAAHAFAQKPRALACRNLDGGVLSATGSMPRL